jgi:hypothetical protein
LRLAAVIESFPKTRWTTRPSGTGFALLEHVCHLRDLDAVYAARIRAVLTAGDLPSLPSVDGTALARSWRARRSSTIRPMRWSLTNFGWNCGIDKPLTSSQCSFREIIEDCAGESLIRLSLSVWQHACTLSLKFGASIRSHKAPKWRSL